MKVFLFIRRAASLRMFQIAEEYMNEKGRRP